MKNVPMVVASPVVVVMVVIEQLLVSLASPSRGRHRSRRPMIIQVLRTRGGEPSPLRLVAVAVVVVVTPAHSAAPNSVRVAIGVEYLVRGGVATAAAAGCVGVTGGQDALLDLTQGDAAFRDAHSNLREREIRHTSSKNNNHASLVARLMVMSTVAGIIRYVILIVVSC